MQYQIGYPEGDWRLAGFAQKLRSGHLGIYGSPTPAPQEDAPMSAAEVKHIEDFIKGFCGPIYETAAAALKEQTGSKIVDDFSTPFKELGGRTQVQALQAILDHLNIGPKAGK